MPNSITILKKLSSSSQNLQKNDKVHFQNNCYFTLHFNLKLLLPTF